MSVGGQPFGVLAEPHAAEVARADDGELGRLVAGPGGVLDDARRADRSLRVTVGDGPLVIRPDTEACPDSWPSSMFTGPQASTSPVAAVTRRRRRSCARG